MMAAPAAALAGVAVPEPSEIRRICEKAGGDDILSGAFEGLGLIHPHLVTSLLGGLYSAPGGDPANLMAGKRKGVKASNPMSSNK